MKPLQLDFKPSIYLSLIVTLFVFVMCGIVISTVLPIEFAWQWKMLAITMILGTAVYTVSWKAWLRLPWSYVGLRINSKNELQLSCRNGQLVAVQVADSSVVTPYLTVIRIKKSPTFLHSKAIILLPDHIANQDAYRELRVWLRWGVKRET